MDKPSARLAAIRNAARKPSMTAQFSTGLLTVVLAVVQTSLIAWFGFALSGKLELALRERSMALQSATALASLVHDLQDPGKDAPTQAAYVRKIAMYGKEAVQPLTIMAAATGPYDEEVPLKGLLLVAIHHKTDVCRSLLNVVESGTLVDSLRSDSIKAFYGRLQC